MKKWQGKLELIEQWQDGWEYRVQQSSTHIEQWEYCPGSMNILLVVFVAQEPQFGKSVAGPKCSRYVTLTSSGRSALDGKKWSLAMCTSVSLVTGERFFELKCS